MLDRSVTVRHRQGGADVRSAAVWAERTDRVARGDNRDGAAFRLRWADWIFNGVIGSAHSEEVLLVDGANSYRLEEAEEDFSPAHVATGGGGSWCFRVPGRVTGKSGDTELARAVAKRAAEILGKDSPLIPELRRDSSRRTGKLAAGWSVDSERNSVRLLNREFYLRFQRRDVRQAIDERFYEGAFEANRQAVAEVFVRQWVDDLKRFFPSRTPHRGTGISISYKPPRGSS